MRDDADASTDDASKHPPVTKATAVAFALTALELSPCEADVLTHTVLAPGADATPLLGTGPWSPKELDGASDALIDRGLLADGVKGSALSPVPHLAGAVAASVRDRQRLARAESERDREVLHAAIVSRMREEHTTRLGPSIVTDEAFSAAISGSRVVINTMPAAPPEDLHLYYNDESNAVSLALSKQGDRVGTEVDIVTRQRLQVPAEASYFGALSAESHCQVNVSDTILLRLALIDDRMAIVPTDPHHHVRGAWVTSDPDAVAFIGLQMAIELSMSPLFAPAVTPRLTPREVSVLQLLAHGHTDQSVARRLGISDRSVRRVVVDLQQKLGVDSRFQLAVAAARQGLL